MMQVECRKNLGCNSTKRDFQFYRNELNV